MNLETIKVCDSCGCNNIHFVLQRNKCECDKGYVTKAMKQKCFKCKKQFDISNEDFTLLNL